MFSARYRHRAPLSLAQRAAATRRVLAVWRERPLDWRARRHCIALAHAQARAMGHRVPALPSIRSPRAARRALDARGFATVEAMMDALFAPIAPAMMLAGDICTLPAEPDSGGAAGLAAVCIADGMGNLFGWHGATGFSRLSEIKYALAACTGAWRLGE
ncbi:MAG TPA: hypothetical protein PKD48_04490 [Sphingopyxis sp.]|nr:hypothetical protein [Sphingopyxis sp.]